MILCCRDILPRSSVAVSRGGNVLAALLCQVHQKACQPAVRQPDRTSKAAGKVTPLTAEMVSHAVTQHMAEAMEVERTDKIQRHVYLVSALYFHLLCACATTHGICQTQLFPPMDWVMAQLI